MGILDIISGYVDKIFVVTLIVGLALGGAAFYLFKIKKVTAKAERIDYSTYNRVDATEYAKFENIVADDEGLMDNAGMIALGNGVFVAGINVTGYNFSSASAEERQRTMSSAIQFFNVVEEPIQMRQTVKAIELTRNIDEFVEIYGRLKEELDELELQYGEAQALADDYYDDKEACASIKIQLEELARKKAAKKFEVDEADVLIKYMKGLTVNSKDTTKINQIMFEYVFNPNDFTEELSEEEIYLQAFQELSIKAKKFGEALARCGCTCERLSAGELVSLLRRHCAPKTTDSVALNELFDSSYDELFVTSSSLLDYELEKRGEEEHIRRMGEFREKMDKVARRARLDAARDIRQTMDNVKKVADAEMAKRSSL